MVVESKAGAFEPEHTGQLGRYLNAVDAQVNAPDDGPTIGLHLCKSQNASSPSKRCATRTSPFGVPEYLL